MSRLNKQLIFIFLLTLVLLVGCDNAVNLPSNNNSKDEPVDYEPIGRTVYSPVKIPYAVDNPIEFINIDESIDDNHRREYFKINGLKDKNIEDNINESIKLLFKEMLPYANGEKLPPYRGIETVISRDKKANHSGISVYPEFNCNNVLSVIAHVSASYSYNHFSTIETLNIDLNTGKILSIEDLFANDVNGIELANNIVADEIRQSNLRSGVEYDAYNSLTLVAPFKGINHEQKFYLTNNGIYIVIDYNNPEFEVGFVYRTVTMPFHVEDGYIAVTKRFYDESESIFTREAKGRRFLTDYQREYNDERNTYNKDGIEWYVSINYPKDLDEGIVNIIEGIRGAGEERVELLSKESPILFVEQSIYSHYIGKYINISEHMYIGRENQGLWQQGSYVYSQAGELIELGDLFVNGYDYEKVIREAIERTIKDYGLSQAYSREVLINDLMFAINDSSLNFTSKTYDWNLNDVQLSFNVPYEEFSYKNLKIFD